MFSSFHARSLFARAVAYVAVSVTVACTFFGCGDDAGRKLSPAGDAGASNGGGAGAGAGSGGAPDATCGDGTRTGDEECDDGNTVSDDGCDDRCRIEAAPPACGDGLVGDDEECDDGDLERGDGCDDRCREERCGNRRIDVGEECDPPATRACTASCVRFSENCGDGSVQEDEGEQCDDANDDPEDGCHDCRLQCGNGRIDRALGEDCEPSLSSPERCSDECKWQPVCGDGEVEPSVGEECDPSNGVTCVACRVRDPRGPCDDGAGGAPSSGSGGCGGSGGAGECVPSGTSELVRNGNFDADFSDWQPHTTAVALRAADDGSPNPKALEVTLGPTPVRAISGAYQCIPVLPGKTYEFTGRYKIPADAPADVAVGLTALLYAGTRCDGTFLAQAGTGPQGSVRDTWTPYQATLSTAALPESAGEGRMLVRLGVIRPANITARVLWDSVSVSAPGAVCGNCVVDEDEACDDGNQTPGDGCSSTCRLETCGDGARQGTEACDDGNTVFGGDGDACTPSCRRPSDCDTCSASQCREKALGCLGLTGVAERGPRAGTPRSVLCDELRTCVYESACHIATRTTGGVTGEFLENCYCGTSGDRCFDTPGSANGSCRAEVEAALESANPATLLGRIGGVDERYPVFTALRELIACEDDPSCAGTCVPEPTCGDGLVQDRNLDFTFIIEREPVPCKDEYTATGHGCSFEECDDGDVEPGDGCDQYCFLESCGNYIVQAGEECDDGNRTSGDGCSAECLAEFDCGNGVVEEPFEECDPPGGSRVCTEAEATSNPSMCGCDDDCSHIVCGNDVVQTPEECDPPNGFSCDTNCTTIGQGPCETCISASMDLGPVNEMYCNSDPDCVAVKQCVYENDECYLPVPAACYCGEIADFAECRAPSFVPTGVCRDVIVAGAGGDDLDNATVLDRFFDFGYPTGVAMSILDEASRQCATECFPTGM